MNSVIIGYVSLLVTKKTTSVPGAMLFGKMTAGNTYLKKCDDDERTNVRGRGGVPFTGAARP